MSTPVLDPVLLDQLSRRCKSVATEIDRLGAEVYALSLAVHADAAPATAATRVAAPSPAAPAFAVSVAAAPVAAPSAPGMPSSPVPTAPLTRPAQTPAQAPQAAYVPALPRPPHGQVAAREPWWERDGVISRVLALGGVAITLVGVVMLLVLAARAGLLRPEVRVALGAVLAGSLVGGGLHIQGRPGGRVGGMALVATGVVAGYLDILAVTSLYRWVAAPVGLALAALVAAGGVLIARRWNSPQLLIITTVAAVLTAPVITAGVTRTLVVFYLLLQVSGALLELIDGWTWLAPVRTTPVVLAAVTLQMLTFGESRTQSDWITDAHWNLVVALVILTVGIAAASIRPERQQVPALAALVAGVSAVPTILALVASTRPVAVGAGIALAAALLGARSVTPRPAQAIRTVDATLAGLVLAMACAATRPDDVALRALPFLVVAIVSLVLSLQTEATFVRAYAAVYSTLAALGVLITLSPGMLARGGRAVFSLTIGSALTGLLLVVVSGLAIAVLWRIGLVQRWRWVLIAPVFFGLYGVTAVCVALPVVVMESIEGFHVGHLLATFTWALAGAAALAFGLARPSWARQCLAIGLTLIAAAVAKLLTYDLASLTGLTRAVAFLGIGLLLLVAGTRYARVFADRETPPGPPNGAGGLHPTPPRGAAPGAPSAPVGPPTGAARPRSVG